jgi:hypothetical protein
VQRTGRGRPSPGEASGWFCGAQRPRGAGRAARCPWTTMRGGAASASSKASQDQLEQTQRHVCFHARLSITAGHRLRPTSGTPQVDKPVQQLRHDEVFGSLLAYIRHRSSRYLCTCHGLAGVLEREAGARGVGEQLVSGSRKPLLAHRYRPLFGFSNCRQTLASRCDSLTSTSGADLEHRPASGCVEVR